jgi:outer membrane protein TolC
MIRYEEGVAIQVEVSDAETALVQARINYVSARYDYLTALAQLQRATASQPEYGRLTSAAPAAVVSQGVKK